MFLASNKYTLQYCVIINRDQKLYISLLVIVALNTCISQTTHINALASRSNVLYIIIVHVQTKASYIGLDTYLMVSSEPHQ